MIPLLQPARLRGQGANLGLPAWASLASCPNGSITDVSLNTIDDVWDVGPDSSGYPIGGSNQLFYPWVSATIGNDFGPYGTYLVGPGGGHTDGENTGVYGWSLQSRLWTLVNGAAGFPVRLNASSHAAPSPATKNATYNAWDDHPDVAGGVIVPRASHHYNSQGVMDARWAGNTSGFYVYLTAEPEGGLGFGGPALVFVDLDTGIPYIGVSLAGMSVGGLYGGIVVDNTNGHIYIYDGYDYSVYRVTLTEGGSSLPISKSAFATIPGTGSPHNLYYHPAQDIPERGIIAFLLSTTPGGTDYSLYALDSGGTFTSKASLPFSTYGINTVPGMFWSPDTEALYIDKDASEDFVKVSVPDPWTGTWTVSTETATGTRASGYDPNYLYQKMRYSIPAKGALCALRADGPMQFYRPEGTL